MGLYGFIGIHRDSCGLIGLCRSAAAPPPPPREIQEDPTPEQSHPTPQEVSNQVAYHQKGETDHQTAATKSQRAFDITSRNTNALAQSIVEDLRKPDSLRKALVLREILGPPVSLRNGQTDGGI